jgi:uncharacterized membrane protein
MHPVIYVKSFIAGIAALIASVCAIAAITFATFYFTEIRRAGSAGIGAVSVGIPVWWLVIPATAFVAGFGWEFRRASRHSRVKPQSRGHA